MLKVPESGNLHLRVKYFLKVLGLMWQERQSYDTILKDMPNDSDKSDKGKIIENLETEDKKYFEALW